MYAPDSIDLLTTAGIDFQNHLEHGIDPDDFAELLISSGLVLSDDVRWISYHRCVLSSTQKDHSTVESETYRAAS